jgi:hypothetical protein
MTRGIVITTSEYTKDWLGECLASISNYKYPIAIRYNSDEDNRWELAGIKKGKDTFDEFVHLMDTTIIKDSSLFDKLFEVPGHVFLTSGGYHYMGKFVSADLPDIPTVHTKQEAVAYETRWLQRPCGFFEPDLPVHTDVFVEKHGRRNMVLENDYLIKYKSTWSI